MESVADGVWRIKQGFPLSVNAYLVSEDDWVAVFDAGIKPMGPKLREAADSLGGATRVILGNAHADHRGGAAHQRLLRPLRPKPAAPGQAPSPHPAFNWSTDAASESIRKLAALEPTTCWPGHYGPLTGEVRAELEAIV